MTRKVSKLNNYLKRHYAARTVVGCVLAFFLLAALQYPARSLYYGNFSGEWFLNVQSAAVTYTDSKGKTSTNIPQNKAGDFELIRSPRTRVTGYNVVRTFYLNATGDSVMQRVLPSTIEYERNITRDVIPLKQTQRPNDLGVYFFCQEVSFRAQGFEKHASFCTTTYRIVPPVED